MKTTAFAWILVLLVGFPNVAQGRDGLQGVTTGDWLSRVQRGIGEYEYGFASGPAVHRPELGTVWQAPNRALDVRIYLDADGVELFERSSEDAPAVLRLALVGWGRGPEVKMRPTGAVRLADGRLERLRCGLVETFANSASGLELGWRLDVPPQGDGLLVLRLVLEGATANARGGGAEIVSTSGRRLVLQAPRAVDGAGSSVETELVVVGRGLLELRVDDRRGLGPIEIKTLLNGETDAVLESNQSNSEMGWSVSTAGDVNGDGFDDVIVGARSYDGGDYREGAAFVFLGSVSGIIGSSPADAHAVIESDFHFAFFGQSVSTAGDVNGDGFDDVIVGARFYENGESDEGSAFVFLGSASGITGSSPADAQAAIEADQADALMGRSVSTAGDVNGDGFDDVIVGAYLYDNGENDEGSAFVFLGSASGIIGSSPADAHAAIEGDQALAQMGYAVSTAGDVNGDGYDDVIVGGYGYDNGESDEGSAFVYYGSSSGITGTSPADAHATFEADQAGAHMGVSVSTAGDVNGDGFDDVIVGAHGFESQGVTGGSAFVFLGSDSGIVGASPLDAHAELEGAVAWARMGSSVSTAGDVNGDGFDDLIIGADWLDVGEVYQGGAFVFFGSAFGITGTSSADADVAMIGDHAGASLGTSVSTAGDVNGDGFDDVIVGVIGYDNGQSNEGAAFVFLGGVDVDLIFSDGFESGDAGAWTTGL